jgi:hypothetical protein
MGPQRREGPKLVFNYEMDSIMKEFENSEPVEYHLLTHPMNVYREALQIEGKQKPIEVEPCST